jgi:hypothetical protein
MRLHRKSTEPDLVVEPTILTETEHKELAEFIRQYRFKQKKKLKKKKHPHHKRAA